jgi:hypothetical protein
VRGCCLPNKVFSEKLVIPPPWCDKWNHNGNYPRASGVMTNRIRTYRIVSAQVGPPNVCQRSNSLSHVPKLAIEIRPCAQISSGCQAFYTFYSSSKEEWERTKSALDKAVLGIGCDIGLNLLLPGVLPCQSQTVRLGTPLAAALGATLALQSLLHLEYLRTMVQ